MGNIALNIKTKDWLYILLIGIVFGMLLSSLEYILLAENWLSGALFGIILGFIITVISLVFISYMNKNILPKLPQIYWLPMAITFSFLSGFLGTLVGTYLAKLLHVDLITAFQTDLLKISIAIGILTYIVGTLLYRFVKMRNQKEVLDHAYMESRLVSLETQLNPHFLFNALNSIAELIYHDPDKAEAAVLKVSSFLRNTMNEKALISMENEIKNVKEYVELENIRFSGRIKLHITKMLPSWNVPKFSIQLVVENAIKHGFKANQSDLNIFVTCDIENHRIIIKNDGVVMKSATFGLGLANLNQRLALLCQGNITIKTGKEPTFYINLGDNHAHTHSR